MAKSFKELISSLNLPAQKQKLLQEVYGFDFNGTKFDNAEFSYHTKDPQFKSDLLNFTVEFDNWTKTYWPKVNNIFKYLNSDEQDTIQKIKQYMDVMFSTIKPVYKELKS